MCKALLWRAWLSLLVLVATASCVKNEFNVEVTLPADVNNTYLTLYYASNSKMGMYMEGVISVEKGKGQMRGVTRNPLIVYIFNGRKAPATFFYAERGDRIEITGDGSDPLGWQIGGNDINKSLSEWRSQNLTVLKKSNPSAHSGMEAVNKAVAAYVTKNPGDPVSTLLMLEYYDRSVDEDGFRRTWSLLKSDAADGKWRELVARADMLEDSSKPVVPGQWIIKRAGGGRDTIAFGEGPVLLHFNIFDDLSFSPNTEKLKGMAQNRELSQGAWMANVMLDADSLVALQAISRDSTVAVRTEWVPLGLSDKNVQRLGIRKVPYIIVVDKSKKTVYSGSDIDEALKEFEKLK